MSVTFSLPRGFESITDADREAVRRSPCPECGGQRDYCGVTDPAKPSRGCSNCHGYGGDTEAEGSLYEREATEDGGFNVANGNAACIVQDLLNLSCEEVYSGSVDPATALTRLAAAGLFAQRSVREPSESCGVVLTSEGVSDGCRMIECGRSLEQVESYVVRLRHLAKIAVERGAPSIIWG